MPLQTGTADLTKVAWAVYIPAWLQDYPVGAELLSRGVAYVNDTPSLVPYGDRYNTVTGVEVTGVKAHPTLGAVYALLAAQPPDRLDLSRTARAVSCRGAVTAVDETRV
jgi:hypothetical protein